jgi:putative nucleotidyltransferase with HDIG domain
MKTNKEYHPADIADIQQHFEDAGITSYAIDVKKFPQTFHSCSFSFVVECSAKKTKEILSKARIPWRSQHIKSPGWVLAIGTKEYSRVKITPTSTLGPIRFKEELWEALRENTAADLLEALADNKLLSRVFPELWAAVGVEGGRHHAEEVFDHLIRSLRAADRHHSLLKFSCLMHDIGKPPTFKMREKEDGKMYATFHRHETVGASIAYKACKRFGFDQSATEYVVKMIRHHMFRFDPATSDTSIKRFLFKLGKNEWRDIFKLRLADREGNLAKKGKPIVTKKMKRLVKRIAKLIATTPVIFKEDLNITELDFQKYNIEPEQHFEVFMNLMGLVNGDSSRNSTEWLEYYLDKTYGKRKENGKQSQQRNPVSHIDA